MAIRDQQIQRLNNIWGGISRSVNSGNDNMDRVSFNSSTVKPAAMLLRMENTKASGLESGRAKEAMLTEAWTLVGVTITIRMAQGRRRYGGARLQKNRKS